MSQYQDPYCDQMLAATDVTIVPLKRPNTKPLTWDKMIAVIDLTIVPLKHPHTKLLTVTK